MCCRNKRYCLRLAMIPSYISMQTAAKILFTGKAVQVLPLLPHANRDVGGGVDGFLEAAAEEGGSDAEKGEVLRGKVAEEEKAVFVERLCDLQEAPRFEVLEFEVSVRGVLQEVLYSQSPLYYSLLSIFCSLLSVLCSLFLFALRGVRVMAALHSPPCRVS